MDDIDFAQSMKRSTSSSQRGRSVRRTDTSTVYGTAMTDSIDGSVRVDLGGSIIGGDGMVGVTCPTTVTVRKGDTVLVQLVGARGTAQSPIVVGCVGRGDVQQGEINEAKEEADEAKTAAEQAKQSAKDAADAASDAQQSASDAADAAHDAIDEAGKATKAAGDAMDAATTAGTAASNAMSAATAAGTAANEANTAARGAVAGLGQVQDVLGTLDWIRKHGTYALTEDTTVDPSKVYYTRSGTAPDYTYAPVAEPKDEELATYYELSVDEALAEFVGTHLALLSDGLHIVSSTSGYYIVLNNDSMRVYDPAGTLVAEYSDDVELYQAGVLALRLSDDGMKLFDGLGTDETNVIAHFNVNGVVLGQDDINKTHANVFFDPDEQSGGFGVYNVDENGVSSYTGIENGRLIVGGPNYDESNSEKLEATQQKLSIEAGWMAPEVGMANRSAGGTMFYGRDSSFNPTVNYRVDWNGNISTTGKVTAKGDVSDGVGTLDEVRNAAKPSTIVNLIYPVGSIYMSVNSTSPATLFGGTWQRITGRFLLAATDGGATGGNSTASVKAGGTGGEASHKLTAAESGVPAHNHGLKEINTGSEVKGFGLNPSGSFENRPLVDSGGVWRYTEKNTAASASNAHNNMPPYLSVYIWKRTA